MLSNYFNITVTLEWITFVSAIILLNKSTGTWRLFIPWLFTVLIVETIGWYQSNVLKIYGNALVFNLLTIITIAFFLWFISQSPFVYKRKKYMYGAIFCFVIVALVNVVAFQKLRVYNSISEATGDILIAVFCGLLIFEIISDESDNRNIFQYEYFWLAAGMLFSAMGSAVLYTFLQELQDYYQLTCINVYGYINYTVNALLYVCLLIAFYLRRQNALVKNDTHISQLD